MKTVFKVHSTKNLSLKVLFKYNFHLFELFHNLVSKELNRCIHIQSKQS